MKTRSRERLLQEMREQIQALLHSCASYDLGNKWEAKRLAAIMHILLHDRGRTKSLLGQIGIKGSTRYLASGFPDEEWNQGSYSPLVCVSHRGWEPMLGRFSEISKGSMVQFHDWWEGTVFRSPRALGGAVLTRKNLVFSVRDQDGGSHFDEQLGNPLYEAIVDSKYSWAGYMLSDGSFSRHEIGAQLAMVRQIA